MKNVKVFQDDGLSYTPEAIRFATKCNELFRDIWKKGKRAGFEDADLYMLIMRDVNLSISTTMLFDRLAKWEEQERNREVKP